MSKALPPTTSFNARPGGDPTALAEARNAAHYAIQLVAAAGETWLGRDPSYHHSAATWEDGRMRGMDLDPAGLRVRLDLSTLTLEVAVGDAAVAALPLLGVPPGTAIEWLRTELQQRELPARDLVFPDWDLPNGPLHDQGPFHASLADLATLQTWFADAHATLSRLAQGWPGASEIRTWPHHFDMATLVDLGHMDGDQQHTVGVGMIPGDGGIAQPYLYVTPWPYPQTWATCPLPAGRWNVEGWYGAVLEAEAITDQAQVDGFLRAAFAHAAAHR